MLLFFFSVLCSVLCESILFYSITTTATTTTIATFHFPHKVLPTCRLHRRRILSFGSAWVQREE